MTHTPFPLSLPPSLLPRQTPSPAVPLRTPTPAPVAVCSLRCRRCLHHLCAGLPRWLSLRCPNPGAPGPDSPGLPSPSAGIMRAIGTLQVLGFLLSLARGSEMGNSQAGKPRGEPQQAGSGERARLERAQTLDKGFGF